MQENYQNLIVGAGISGAVLARLLAERGEAVLVIDRRNHIGGNCFDYQKNGINIHKYGPHIFRTDSDEVWQFLSRFTSWHKYTHKVRAIIDGKEIPVPFNFTAIDILFEPQKAKIFKEKLLVVYGENKKVSILELKESTDKDLQELADFVYEKIFYHYTVKQWELKPEELDSEVMARVPIYTSYFDGYFTEKYQAIPQNGYMKMFENMLSHKNIKVILNTDFKNLKNIKYNRVFYCGAIDEYFDYKLGALPYRSLSFDLKDLPQEKFQSVAVVNYTGKESHTRITEFKHFLGTQTKNTIIAYEYPCSFERNKNERYYPIPTETNEDLYKKYLALSEQERNIHFLGRLGNYKFYSMQSAVLAVFELFKKINPA